MSGHVPPPGAIEAIERLSENFLADVQRELGTSHKRSVLEIAILGLLKIAGRFGVDMLDQFEVVRRVQIRIIGGKP